MTAHLPRIAVPAVPPLRSIPVEHVDEILQLPFYQRYLQRGGTGSGWLRGGGGGRP